jgi:hypothetical protein
VFPGFTLPAFCQHICRLVVSCGAFASAESGEEKFGRELEKRRPLGKQEKHHAHRTDAVLENMLPFCLAVSQRTLNQIGVYQNKKSKRPGLAKDPAALILFAFRFRISS